MYVRTKPARVNWRVSPLGKRLGLVYFCFFITAAQEQDIYEAELDKAYCSVSRIMACSFQCDDIVSVFSARGR